MRDGHFRSTMPDFPERVDATLKCTESLCIAAVRVFRKISPWVRRICLDTRMRFIQVNRKAGLVLRSPRDRHGPLLRGECRAKGQLHESRRKAVTFRSQDLLGADWGWKNQ